MNNSLITVRNSSRRKLMFSETCVKNSVHGGGGGGWVGGVGRGEEACVKGGHTWQGGMHGGGHAWWGRAWQERQPLQRTVHILLECILV